MNRTSCVARVAWSVSRPVALVMFALGCESTHVDPDVGPRGCCEPPGSICLCDSGVVDAGAMHDEPEIIDPMCAGAGRIGAHCRSGSTNRCVNASTCLDPPVSSVQSAFMLRQAGGDDAAHPGYALVQDPAVPADDAPFNGAAGSLCAQACDPTVADTCGSCTTCNGALTQMPLVAAFGGARTVLPAGGPQGICRLDCRWSATAASTECPDQMACDAFSATCIEACTTDVECNTGIGASYAGEILTQIDTEHPRHCDHTTGRCAATGRTDAQVGDACASDDDCLGGSGVCLSGGHCAEFGCTNPNTATSVCGGATHDVGICLTTSASSTPTALCILGCNTAVDCGPGNVCTPLLDTAGNVVMIGNHSGYCIGACDSDEQCLAAEACTDGTVTDATGTHTTPGRCVPRCTAVGMIGAASGGCDTGEFCEADHTGASYGHCSAIDQFCGAGGTVGLAAASTECPTGYVCDEMLAGAPGSPDAFGDGHCTTACATDGDCTAPRTCVTTGTLTGLCRHACTTPTDCAATEMCSTGWCVER